MRAMPVDHDPERKAAIESPLQALRPGVRKAICATVTPYIGGGPLLHVAQAPRRGFEDARCTQRGRRDIAKAKGMLTTRRGLDDGPGSELQRCMAMHRNLKLGEAARALIAAAELP